MGAHSNRRCLRAHSNRRGLHAQCDRHAYVRTTTIMLSACTEQQTRYPLAHSSGRAVCLRTTIGAMFVCAQHQARCLCAQQPAADAIW
jgi:hypothetical protein